MAKIKKSLDCPKRLPLHNVDISIYNSQKAVPLACIAAKKMVQKLLCHFKVEAKGLAVHFVTKKQISSLHHQFFSDPSPTDCISFPIDSEFLGEIFISPEAAIEYTENKKIDLHTEISRYLIHGFLHLLGFDDQDVQSKKRMRQKERECLKLFKEQGLTLK